MLVSDAIKDAPLSLREDVRHWWMLHRDDLTALAVEDVDASVVDFLQRGDSFEARIEIAANLDRAEWAAYRDRTTAALSSAAANQIALMRALTGLGRVGAMALGSVLAGALQRASKSP